MELIHRQTSEVLNMERKLETRIKISTSIKRKFDNDVEYRRRHLEGCRSPEARAKISRTLHARYLDPFNREKIRAQFTPEVRAKMSKSAKRRFEDPKERIRLRERHIAWRKSLTPEQLLEYETKRLKALRVKRPWNKGLTKETNQILNRVAMAKLGKKRTPEQVKKFAQISKARWANATEEERVVWNKKNSETHKKMLADPEARKAHLDRLFKWVKSDEHRKKVSENSRQMWANRSSQRKEEVLRKIRKTLGIKPNKPERFLIPILKPFGFKYTGAGTFFIVGPKRVCIPDFVNIGQKLIIEFDGIYWHKQSRDKDRNELYRTKGYRVLSIQEDDIQHGREYIQSLTSNFVLGQMEISQFNRS